MRLQKLAADPRYLGARIGALSVLHTWTRAMLFHPHVHMLVTAGGLSPDGSWIDPKHPRFLVPVQALSMIFRAKICAGLKKAGLLDGCAALTLEEKLGRSLLNMRAVVKRSSNISAATYTASPSPTAAWNRIDNGQVRFRYRDNQTQQIRHVTLPAVEFIGRFLQHVLPRGCAQSPVLRNLESLLPTATRPRPDVAFPKSGQPPIHWFLYQSPNPLRRLRFRTTARFAIRAF